METKNIYALVTGGTQGIGRYVANLLAGEGYNLIVIGHDSKQMGALSGDIQSRFPVAVHTYEADLTSPDDAFVLYRDIKDQEIQIATIAHSVHERKAFKEFAQTGIAKQYDAIQSNITNFIVLTRLFLPEMIARHSGKLISAVEDKHIDTDPNAVYAATVAFLDSFMSSMTSELKGSGVSVSNIRSSMAANTSHTIVDKSNLEQAGTGMFRARTYKERDGYESFMRDDK